jgi:hypothetical protein
MATTTNINPDTAPQVLQTYALLQIAAEAFLGNEPADPASTPGVPPVVQLDATMLMTGNNHSSKMTAAQAKQFSEEWTVISHQPNTATGFSGTLFQYKGADDPSRGLTNGQYVASFRSTEFIEDTARDNQATNTLELSQGGWAFGQVADMDTWWQSVKSQVGTQGVDVTDYSLGGSLAASFFELYGSKANGGVVNKVYTFNGAGVGTVDAGYSLRGVIDQFKTQRQTGANAGFFTDAVALAEYNRLKSIFVSVINDFKAHRQTGGHADTCTNSAAVIECQANKSFSTNEQEFRDAA